MTPLDNNPPSNAMRDSSPQLNCGHIRPAPEYAAYPTTTAAVTPPNHSRLFSLSRIHFSSPPIPATTAAPASSPP